MTDDEFWIDPIVVDGHVATVRACFNAFTVTISVARKDGSSISAADAERAVSGVMSRMPRLAGPDDAGR